MAGVAGLLLCACGGSKPDPERPGRAAEEVSTSPDPAKGQGVVTFRYSNRSTDANLQVDLGATDISLEMTGHPAEAAPSPASHAAAGPAKPSPQEAGQAAQPSPAPEAGEDPRERGAHRKPGRKPADKAPTAPKPDTEAAEEELGAAEDPVPPDVTDKVLLGIRKAQEFFYQKRYPEALQMVRASLDARPTAEGHALAGSIHYMMGATGLARRHWQQALRLNPDMPAVVNMLEKIATPGGRGSPHPRPLAARRPAAAPSPSVLEAAGPVSEPPFPDELAEPVAPPRPPAPASAPAASPVPAAPAAAPVRTSPAPAAPKAPAAPASSSAPAPSGTAPDEVAAAPAPADIPSAAAPSAAPEAVPATAPAADPAAAPKAALAAPAAPAPGPAVPRPAAGSPPGGKPRFPQKAPAKPAPAGAAGKEKSP